MPYGAEPCVKNSGEVALGDDAHKVIGRVIQHAAGEAVHRAGEAGERRCYKADTIEGLAEAAGMPVETFAATVARYNELGAKGVDEDFGRAGIAPLAAEGPYYAIKVVRATVAGFGGFEINTDAQVLDTEGKAIPGLYAAGECASGQFFDKEYPCSGSMLCISTTFGRIAGQNAAAEAAK